MKGASLDISFNFLAQVSLFNFSWSLQNLGCACFTSIAITPAPALVNDFNFFLFSSGFAWLGHFRHLAFGRQLKRMSKLHFLWIPDKSKSFFLFMNFSVHLHIFRLRKKPFSQFRFIISRELARWRRNLYPSDNSSQNNKLTGIFQCRGLTEVYIVGGIYSSVIIWTRIILFL